MPLRHRPAKSDLGSPKPQVRYKTIADAVQVHILYWGVCHTDVPHPLADIYPGISDRNIVGRVSKVGAHVIVFTHSPGMAKAALRANPGETAVTGNRQQIRQRIQLFHVWFDSLAVAGVADAGAMFLRHDGSLIQGRRSLLGGIKETRRQPDPHAGHDKLAIPIHNVNDVHSASSGRRLETFRFVVDAAWLRQTR
ncbi:hypothetical protein ACH518_15940 [Methylomonas sp. HW2-6]|uniref:hypothetical protein n=1 Tax=Methylomonas sp. HW2-6 TaxID=3376687 RepID=UPI00404282DD